MAENFFAQFDDERTLVPVDEDDPNYLSDPAPQVESPLPSATIVDEAPAEERLMSDEERTLFQQSQSGRPADTTPSPGSENFFSQFDNSDTYQVIERPQEQVEDPGLWDQFVGGWYDTRGRNNFNDAVEHAEEFIRVRDTDKALEPIDPGGGFLGVSGRDITRFSRTVTPEARERFADFLQEQIGESLEKSKELREKGEAIPFSPEVQQFLDENSENGILEDFWNAPFKIIMELGARSGYGSMQAAGTGIVGGAAGSIAGPGGATAGFAAGMGAGSARLEYAATIVEGFSEAGIDLTDPEALIAAVGDRQFIEDLQAKAMTRAGIIGGVDAVTGGVAGRSLGLPVKSAITRELTNQAVQMGIQAGGGAGGEALAQYVTEGEVNLREVAAEAAGELVTAPIDVASAVVAGARAGSDSDTNADTEETAEERIMRAQQEAQERVAAQGGDLMDQALAGQEAAVEVSRQEGAELAARERLQAESEALRQRQVDAELTEAARNQAFKQAEQEAAAQRQEEVQEAEYQRELQRGEETAVVQEAEEAGTVQPSEGTTLGEASPALNQLKQNRAAAVKKKATAAKKKRATKARAKRTLLTLKKQPKQLEDLRPIVVTPEGVAMKPGQTGTPVQLDLAIAEHAKAQGMDEFGGVDTVAGERLEPIPVTVADIDMKVENPKGSTRTGVNDDGTAWSRKLKDHYGEIEDSKGADGENLDVFISSDVASFTSGSVFVVDQVNQESGAFDEHKAMIGYPNEMAARRAYKRNYDAGWKVGAVTEMTMDEFKSWVDERRQKNTPAASAVEPGEVSTHKDDVLSTEEDIIAAQNRAAFKGRKRPKVLYRLGDAKVEVVEETPPAHMIEAAKEHGWDRPGKLIYLQVSDPSFTEAEGFTQDYNQLTMIERGDGYQVIGAYLQDGMKGKQYGQQMLLEAVKYAEARGKSIVSDSSVSVAQLRAYEALRKKGLLVVEYSDPAAVTAAFEKAAKGDDFHSVKDNRPIVKRMFTPEAREEIEYKADLKYRNSMDPESSAPLTAEVVMTELATLLEELSGLEVQVLNSPEEAPVEVYEQIVEDDRLDAKGLYDTEDNVAYVFANNHDTVEDVVETILHEGVAHKGLKTLLGEKLGTLLDDIWENANNSVVRGIKKTAEQYGLKMSNPAERRIAIEEYIAHLAESGSDANLLQRVMDAIRQFLRQAGRLREWTDSDINALLRDVRREVRGRPLNNIEISHQAEVEETGEVVTIHETADRLLRDNDRQRNIAEKLRACVAA